MNSQSTNAAAAGGDNSKQANTSAITCSASTDQRMGNEAVPELRLPGRKLKSKLRQKDSGLWGEFIQQLQQRILLHAEAKRIVWAFHSSPGWDELSRVILGKCRNDHHRAADVLQETLLELIRTLRFKLSSDNHRESDQEHPEELVPLAIVIAKRKVCRSARDNARCKASSEQLEEIPSRLVHQSGLEYSEVKEVVDEVIEKELSPCERKTIKGLCMADPEGARYGDITEYAKRHKISTDAVRQALCRARVKIRNALERKSLLPPVISGEQNERQNRETDQNARGQHENVNPG